MKPTWPLEDDVVPERPFSYFRRIALVTEPLRCTLCGAVGSPLGQMGYVLGNPFYTHPRGLHRRGPRENVQVAIHEARHG